jgi:hypothetical protein
MAPSKDKEPVTPEPAGEEPAGRVEFDSRGNSVWRWARDALDSTSILLKRLENNDLALEPTRKVPIMGGDPKAGKAPKADKTAKADKTDKADKKSRSKDRGLSVEHDGRDDRAGGFDPYNSRR